MRKYIVWICLFLSLTLVAQNPSTLDGWAERLKLFGEKVQQEEVFLHMDNTCYYLGDTIYYKAYMRLSDGRPSPLSKLLYVELLNQDGYLVERQKVEMKNGQGYGSFCLLDTLYGGYYELRAYTRWQLNWGLYEHAHTKNAEVWFHSRKMAHEYYRDYDKLYSRVFPVYDKPSQPGEYMQDMTTRPLRRIYKQKDEAPQAVVKFYPEGGNLIKGVKNRIAFEANDKEGRHLKGRLVVGDQTVETANRGRGVFETDGTLEKAVFEWENGSNSFNLPKPVADGVALQAVVEADGIHVTLHRAGTAVSESLGLTASSHGLLKDFQALTGDQAVVSLAQLPTGVVQLTVFNANGRIYADRLVFVRQPDFQPQTVTFSGLKDEYAPYEQVNLEVSSHFPSSGSTLSVAVRDAGHSDYTFDSGNILTEMLLASQIKGFVEQPEYFFEKDDEEHRKALDLLLMVQGWRRYDWVEMATPGAFSLLHPYERTEVLMGEVNKYFSESQADAISDAMDALEAETDRLRAEVEEQNARLGGTDASQYSEADEGTTVVQSLERERDSRFSADETHNGTTYKTNAAEADNRSRHDYGQLKREALVHADFQQPGAVGGESLVEGEMDTYNHGIFKIEAPYFYDNCLFFYTAIDKRNYEGEKHPWRAMSEDIKQRINYPAFYVKLNPVYPRFVKPYGFYQKNLPSGRVLAGKVLNVDDDVILLDEVKVGARRSGLRRFDASKPAFVLDAYQAFNEVCDAGFCPGYYIGARRFVSDIARTYIGDMNMERAYDVEMRFNSKNQSFYISDEVKEKYNHLPNLDMVYVYTDYSPRLEGDKKFRQDNQPTVTVDLRRKEDEGQRIIYRDRFMLLSGYAVCEDFYQPDYSQRKPSEPTDYRRTLYWNPNVVLDAQGHATLHFYNNSHATQVTVSAEGMTTTGAPLTGISYPEDR